MKPSTTLDDPLAGAAALVTGAGSGVGRAIAVGLAARGARLFLVGRTGSALDAVASDLRRSRAAAPTVLAGDVADDGDVARLVDRVLLDAPGVDLLVHSAGAISLGRIDQTPIDELDRQYRTNLRGAFRLTQLLLPSLRARRGQIAFVNSTAGLTARAGVAAYAATKHALKAVADSLREEVNADGVRVINVFLGRTATPMQAAVHAAEGRPYRPELLLQPEDVAAALIAALGLPRTAEVTEIHMRPAVKSY